MTTRLLFDEHALYYDIPDAFYYAKEGDSYTDRWPCGVKDINIGDKVYFLDSREKDLIGIFARGKIVKAQKNVQLCQYEGYENFSQAYCIDDEYELEDDSTFYVTFQYDSIVTYDTPLKISSLIEEGFPSDIFKINNSGDIIPEEYASKLDRCWETYVEHMIKSEKGLKITTPVRAIFVDL